MGNIIKQITSHLNMARTIAKKAAPKSAVKVVAKRPCNKCKLPCCAKKCICGTKACKAFGTKCCGPRPCTGCKLACCAKKCVCGTKACKAAAPAKCCAAKK